MQNHPLQVLVQSMKESSGTMEHKETVLSLSVSLSLSLSLSFPSLFSLSLAFFASSFPLASQIRRTWQQMRWYLVFSAVVLALSLRLSLLVLRALLRDLLSLCKQLSQ